MTMRTNFGNVVENFEKFESEFCEDFLKIFEKFDKIMARFFQKFI